MKLKTNKLLTLTLASSLVAITAGCGGTKAAAPKTGTTTTPADTVAYNDWTSGATQATALTDNGFLAGNTAGTGLTLVPTTTPATVVETLTLNSTVTAATTTATANGVTTKGVSAVTLGGAAADGVAFFTVPGTAPATDARYFAGLLANTDLGGPITATIASANATWNGLFQAIGDAAHTTAATSFTLNVNFADNEISAHIEAAGAGDVFATGNNSYYLEGTFVTATGLITGNIIFGGYAAADAGASLLLAEAALGTATAADATGAATNGRGIVTGLIGAQGVLGAFHSNGTDGDGALGFAGGFVATTVANAGGDDPDAVYADWAGSDDVTIADDLTSNGFLASLTTDADGLTPNTTPASTFTTLNLAEVITEKVETDQGGPGDATARAGVAGTDGVRLGGEAADGVAFFTTGATTESRYFAGLHFGTDLGAPITVTTGTATWNGLIQTVSGTPASMFGAKAFELTVNFADSEVSAHVTTDAAGTDFAVASYYLTGEYDDAGVITGTVSYSIIANTNDARTASTANGVLSGLIGQTEAVGAFHSEAETALGYAGGFVATSAANVTDAADALVAYDPVEYADWTGSFTSPTLPAASATTAPTANAFVTGTATALDLPSAITGTANLNLATGSTLSGDAMDGVAFVTTGTAASTRVYAGLLNTTDLGLPLTLATAGGTWTGLFQAVGDSDHATAARAFTLTVAFATNAISGNVPAGASSVTTVDANPAYYLSGSFDAATGVITGKVLFTNVANAGAGATALGTATTATAGHGTLTGLIGQGGAVGAFISNNTVDGTGALGYAGGFVVNN